MFRQVCLSAHKVVTSSAPRDLPAAFVTRANGQDVMFILTRPDGIGEVAVKAAIASGGIPANDGRRGGALPCRRRGRPVGGGG